MRTSWIAALLLLAPAAWSKKPVKPAPTPPAPRAAEAPGETPARIAEYRHEVMEAAGGHTSALFMIVKGESKRTADLVAHAEALNHIAAMLPDLFPAGTGPDHATDTAAKAEIWTNQADFASMLSTFRTNTQALVEAAKGGDMAATKQAAFAVGGSCGDCHDKYRLDEEHH